MPHAEHTPPQEHPAGNGDAQDGTKKPKDGALKEKAAEFEQAADGTVNLASTSLRDHWSKT